MNDRKRIRKTQNKINEKRKIFDISFQQEIKTGSLVGWPV
jgi:hypothetical protein